MDLLAQFEPSPIPLPTYPSDLKFKFGGVATLGNIVTDLLPYVFVAAGLLLLGLLIWGGFQYLTSGGDPKAVEAAKGRLTGAIAGFIIIFTSYWVIQAVEIIFKLDIL